MSRRLNKCFALLLAIALIVTSVPNSGLVVDATDAKAYESFTQNENEMTVISEDYGDETYNVFSVNLKATDEITYDWTKTIVVGVSGTSQWKNYGFQLAYGTSSSENLVKLNSGKGYGSFDGITVAQEQWYNNEKIEKLFSADGMDIKVVRLNTWAYFLANMGEGYELIGRMYVPSSASTQFSIYNNATQVEVNNITLEVGKQKALAALSGITMNITEAAEYFPVNSSSWTVEGRLTTDMEAVAAWESTDKRIAMVGTSTWAGSVAVNCQSGTWKGQGITSWSSGNISNTHTELLASGGMWVRWVREGNTLSLWTSADGEMWTRIVANSALSADAAGVYITNRNTNVFSKLSDISITDTSEYPSFELATAGMTTITGSYGEETYNVMTAHLKALDAITYDWSSLFLVGVSGTTKYANYGFQILYGTSQGANRIKLNENKGYGTFDGITISRDQVYNDVKLEQVYADGIDIKVVRMNTWAYLLADMGDGYELLGRMYIPSTEATQFTLYSNKSRVQMTNVTIGHGKENTLAALDDMSMTVTSTADYFPINSTSWTVEGRLTADTDVVAASTATDNRIAIVGTSTWAGTVAVNCQSGTWKGQGITNWSAGNINGTQTALLASEGMWVRWVREGSTLSLWTSADGETWTHIVDNPQLSGDATGVYIKVANDSYASKLTDMKIVDQSEYPSFEQAAGEMTTITGSYGEETYNVMTGHLRALDAITYDWSSLFLVGVSGTSTWGNYGFQILYGTSQGANRIKLNENKGYGTYDEVAITRDQIYDDVKLEKLFTDGVDIKVVRLDTWSYLLVDMGEGYELLGRMCIPSTEATQFTLYSNKSRIQMTNVTIGHGKDNALAALEGMSVDVSAASNYFPVDSTNWTLQGILKSDKATLTEEVNRIAYAGTNGWSEDIAIAYRTDWDFEIWGGEELTNWAWTDINNSHIEKVESDGMWVRWVREGNILSLWTSADGERWVHVVDNTSLSQDATGVFLGSENAAFTSNLSDVKITLSADYPSNNVNTYNFSNSSEFTYYSSGDDSYSTVDGLLTPSGSNSELKAILNEEISDIKSISVDIIPGTSELIEAGLYVGAENASDTSIDALSFQVKSNYTGWGDAPNRIDLVTKELPANTVLQQIISEKTNANAIYTKGYKETLNLRLDFEGDTITVTLSLKEDPEKYIQTIYNIDTSSLNGKIGLGSFYSDVCFDNLEVTYASRKVETETPTYTNDGYNFSSGMMWQSTKALGTSPNTIEAWVKIPTAIKNNTEGVIISNYREVPTFSLELYKKGQPKLYWRDSDGTENSIVVPDVDLRTGEWTHIAFVRNSDENTVTFYLNGVETHKETNITLNDIEPQIFYVGRNNNSLNKYKYRFIGEVADIRIWDKALTEDALQASMGDEYTTAEGLVLNLPLNDEVPLWVNENYSSYTFADLSSGENTIELYERVFNWTEDTSEPGEFSIVAIPDQQILTRYYPQLLDKLYDWIAANVEKENIQMVINLGDITDDNTTQGWEKSLEVYEKIQDLVPYICVAGNHDYDTSVYRDASRMNAYFPLSMFQSLSTYGGAYSTDKGLEDDSLNTWQEFEVQGKKYIVIALEFGPRDAVLDWANEVVAAHPEHQVIVTTHGYMNYDGTRLSPGEGSTPPAYWWTNSNTEPPNDGEGVWEKFVSKHENIIMVLSGHIGSDDIVTRVDKGEHGNDVVQMLINGQEMDQQFGGFGMLSIFRFSADGTIADVTYFSPDHGGTGVDEYLNDNQFSITLQDKVPEIVSYTEFKAGKQPHDVETYNEKGYVFAGWFEDETCEIALTKDSLVEKAYAKYVDAQVLSVQAQISEEADSKRDIRFVTTVDSVFYKKVGFYVSYDMDGDGINSMSKVTSNKVYRSLLYMNANNGEIMEYYPDKEFSSMSKYFKTVTVAGVPETHYDMEFKVTPFWITLDGTTVKGAPVIKSIRNGL